MIATTLLACSIASCSHDTPTPTPDATDARICAAAFQVPWNGVLMESLTQNPVTPIQTEAQKTVTMMNSAGPGSVNEWHRLSQMCVDAGF